MQVYTMKIISQKIAQKCIEAPLSPRLRVEFGAKIFFMYHQPAINMSGDRSALMRLKDSLRSLHSPPFSGRTPVGLRRTRPIQNDNFLALEWLELSGDFPVTFRCMLVGLVSPTDFHQTSSQIPPEMTGQQRKVRRKSGGLQRTPSRQPSLLVLLIKNKN
jgi:hypothetical protein